MIPLCLLGNANCHTWRTAAEVVNLDPTFTVSSESRSMSFGLPLFEANRPPNLSFGRTLLPRIAAICCSTLQKPRTFCSSSPGETKNRFVIGSSLRHRQSPIELFFLCEQLHCQVTPNPGSFRALEKNGKKKNWNCAKKLT